MHTVRHPQPGPTPNSKPKLTFTVIAGPVATPVKFSDECDLICVLSSAIFNVVFHFFCVRLGVHGIRDVICNRHT